MAATTLLTIDDFERLPAELAENHELVDGALVDVSGNNHEHNLVRAHLMILIGALVERTKLGRVLAEQEYDFNGNAHGPDISFYSAAKFGLVDSKKRVQRFVPDLAIEIASPSDTYDDLMAKKRRYLAAGTSEVSLVSLKVREIATYTPEAVRTLSGSAVLSTPLIPEFSITIDELFEGI
jgi:Uma2 family endonuclease